MGSLILCAFLTEGPLQVRVMTSLRHPNVVLFMAASTKPPKMCIGTLHTSMCVHRLVGCTCTSF
jgi:hypothetical protein